jgi:hypothetical protein
MAQKLRALTIDESTMLILSRLTAEKLREALPDSTRAVARINEWLQNAPADDELRVKFEQLKKRLTEN